MGCASSSVKTTTVNREQNSQNLRKAVEKSENGRNVPATVKSVTRPDKTFQKTNVDKAARESDNNNHLHEVESLEVLAPCKKDKPQGSELENSNAEKAQKRKKELNQVMAWGRKMTTTEQHSFLEDLRLHRDSTSDGLYEKEYGTTWVDETSKFIERADCSGESSKSDILNDLTHHNVKHLQVAEQEESFDASKIIDVEKFRAANVEKNKISADSDQGNEMVFGNDGDFNNLTKSSKEIHMLNSSLEDFTMDKKEESFNKIYNEDDENLIESIEREFLLTHDNCLPGQIIN